MVRWKISVEQRGLERKMRNLRRRMLKGSLKTVDDLTAYAKSRAQFLVPYDKGLVFKAITRTWQQTNTGAKGSVFVKATPRPDAGETGAQTNADLAYIMHHWSQSKRHFSNDPHFMFTVRKELNQKKKGTAQSAFDGAGLNIK